MTEPLNGAFHFGKIKMLKSTKSQFISAKFPSIEFIPWINKSTYLQ